MKKYISLSALLMIIAIITLPPHVEAATNLSATVTGNTVRLTWTPESRDDHYSVFFYTVPASSPGMISAVYPSSTSSYTSPALRWNTDYQFELASVQSDGTSSSLYVLIKTSPAPSQTSPANANVTPPNPGGQAPITPNPGGQAPIAPNPGGSTGNSNVFYLQNPLDPKFNSVGSLVQGFLEIFSYLVVLLAVLMLIWVGLQFVLAQGKPERMKELKNWLLWIVVGVAIVIGARIIVTVVINTLEATGTVSPGVIQNANNAIRGN